MLTPRTPPSHWLVISVRLCVVPHACTQVQLADTVIRQNTAGQGGGGIYADSAVLCMHSSFLYNNSADRGIGGAVWLYSTPIYVPVTGPATTISNCTLEGNSAGDGGALAMAVAPTSKGTQRLQARLVESRLHRNRVSPGFAGARGFL